MKQLNEVATYKRKGKKIGEKKGGKEEDGVKKLKKEVINIQVLPDKH